MYVFTFGTTIKYEHHLIAPKGYVFNLDQIKKNNIFTEDEKLWTSFDDKILHWEEMYTDMSKNLDNTFFSEHLTEENGCLVLDTKTI